jgi:cobalt-precorrin-5B (C1)-methyltransferase
MNILSGNVSDDTKVTANSSNNSDDLELVEAEHELPEEVEEKKRRGTLRIGYTTGTCATAASKAALIALLTGDRVEEVTVILPKGDRVVLPIKECIIGDGYAECTVVKDAGDDPDVTHGAEIVARVEFSSNGNGIEVVGGKGVGIVTKPGLGLEIDKHAINPTPKRMIIEAVKEVASHILDSKGIKVTISVPRGEELAKKTDNPRLGILGGISILGTTGLVIPYSTASFAASIRQAIDVAIAMGDDTIVLTTGGRSEDYAKNIGYNLPEHCYIQMGDFFAYSVRTAAKRGIKNIVISGFIGKLSKVAKGIKQTHVRGSKVDMDFLASIAMECDADERTVEEVRNANTARHVMEIVMSKGIKGYFDRICMLVCDRAYEYSENRLISIECVMFDFDGNIIGRASKRALLIK